MLFIVNQLIFLKIYLFIYLFIWERVHTVGKGRGRADTPLSVEPTRAGSHDPEIMTWAEIKSDA